MDPDFRSMMAALGRAEVALFLSMARAADGYLKATLRYSRSVAGAALGSVDKANQSGLSGSDRSDLDAYRAYLRELAGVTRVSTIAFIETLERLRHTVGGPVVQAPETTHDGSAPKPRRPVIRELKELRDEDVEQAETVSLRERPGRPARGSPRKGAASKNFLLY